jgi:hypothetical protein
MELGKIQITTEINLFHSCYKIYAQVLNEKLERYSKTILDETQSDFRKG